MRRIACFALVAAIVGTTTGRSYVPGIDLTDVLLASSGAGLVVALSSRPGDWPDSYLQNAMIGLVGAAIGAAIGAASVSPTEYDNSRYAVVIQMAVAGMVVAGVGILAAAGLAWAMSLVTWKGPRSDPS